MNYRLLILPAAERDIVWIVEWWSQHRSSEQANDGIDRFTSQFPSSQINLNDDRLLQKRTCFQQAFVSCILDWAAGRTAGG